MSPPATPPRLAAPKASPAQSLLRAERSNETLRRRLAASRERHRACTLALASVKAQYRQQIQTSRRIGDEARLLARRLLNAQEEERRSISRDLHDEVAQTLAAIHVQLAALQRVSALNQIDWRQKIRATQKMVGNSVQYVRRYARKLRPAMLDDIGLVPTLRALIRDLPRRDTLKITLHTQGNLTAISPRLRIIVYRVVQEALLNVVRHAKAKKVSLSLLQEGRTLRLEVRDDGRSFTMAPHSPLRRRRQLGLLGMRERVEMIGGTFAILATPGTGTALCANLPLQPRKITHSHG